MKVTYLEILEMIKDNRNPNTVKWNGKIYKWDLDNVNYAIYHKDSAEFLYDKQAMSVQATRKDIEIIEEPKEELEEIELIDIHYVNDKCIFKVYGQSIEETIAIKVNELIANQNKIIRELKANKENE